MNKKSNYKKPYGQTLDRIMLYLLVFVIMGLSDAVIPVLPALANNGPLPDGGSSSLIFSSFFIGALLTMILFGVLADAYGHRLFVIFGVLLTLISGFMIIVSNDFWMIVIARFIEGAGCGAFFPSAFALLAGMDKREQYIGEFNFIINLGLAVGLKVTGMLANTGIKNGVMLFEGLMVPIFMISMMVLINNGLGETVLKKSEVFSTIAKSKKAIIHPQYYQIWLLSFVLFGSSGVLIALYPDFVSDVMTTDALGTYLASIYVGAMVTSLVAGRMQIPKDTLVKTSMVFTGIGALGAVFHPIGLTLMGAGSGLGMVGLVTGVSYLNINKGLAMGIFNTCTYAGLALVPILSGLLIPIVGYSSVFIINGILLIIMVLLPMSALSQANSIK